MLELRSREKKLNTEPQLISCKLSFDDVYVQHQPDVR